MADVDAAELNAELSAADHIADEERTSDVKAMNSTDFRTSDSLQNLWMVYSSVNDLIKFADTKAELVLAAQGALVAVGTKGIFDSRAWFTTHPLSLGLLALGVAFGLLSVLFSFMAVVPRLGKGDSPSGIYFDAIRKRSLDVYRERVTAMLNDESLWQDDLASQIWVSSAIAARKYRYARYALVSFAIGIVCHAVNGAVGFFS